MQDNLLIYFLLNINVFIGTLLIINNIIFKNRNEEVKNITSKFHLNEIKREFVKICKCQSKKNIDISIKNRFL